MKKIAFLAAAAMILPTAAFATGAQEISTAATHAGLAAKQTDVMKVHMHLHHALNCLVGPAGEGFDATNANPCAKQGAGAIPDSDAATAAKLKAVVPTLQSGISATDLAIAQKDASDASAAITAAHGM